jgi:hypothetical protein
MLTSALVREAVLGRHCMLLILILGEIYLGNRQSWKAVEIEITIIIEELT